MNYIFDSSSLIYFGKIKLLDKIALLNGKKYIPKEVYREVIVKGKEREELEVDYIERLIKEEAFIIKEPSGIFNFVPFMSKADLDVLSLAKETKSIAIVDEIYASNLAEFYGIESHGSLYLIIKLVKEKLIVKKEAINCIDKMISEGFYISIEKYREILEIIDK